MNIPLMHYVAAGFTALYGLVSIVGGLMGYLNKGSTASLIAAGVAGVLLLLCAVGVFLAAWPVASLIGAIIVSLALVGRFASVLISNREKLGEFVGTTAGMVAIIVVIGGVLVIIVSVAALFTEARPPATP
jgi:uncharacterized membrane protein (UPF0136 family)